MLTQDQFAAVIGNLVDASGIKASRSEKERLIELMREVLSDIVDEEIDSRCIPTKVADGNIKNLFIFQVSLLEWSGIQNIFKSNLHALTLAYSFN